jgi:hypothetical protein
MTGLQLVERARQLKAAFGVKPPKKFSGAATIEILREALSAEGIPVSSRDVFIRGIPVEIDLLVLHKAATPFLGLLYEPQHVAVALEVKKTGTFGEDSLVKIKNDFGVLQKAGVPCAYVTFEERRGYRWAASNECLGFPCFTLAWHTRTEGPLEQTEGWEHLLAFLWNSSTLLHSRA